MTSLGCHSTASRPNIFSSLRTKAASFMEKHPAGALRKLHERTGEERSRPAICNQLAPQNEYIDVPGERQRARQARGVLIFHTRIDIVPGAVRSANYTRQQESGCSRAPS